MPPKGDPSLLTERDQVFLVECVKNSKEKLVPDFDLVAQATSMSKKGAAYVSPLCNVPHQSCPSATLLSVI
jgi:hypothetical protein